MSNNILIVDPVLKLIPSPGNDNPYDDFKIELGINKIGRASSNGIYLKGDPSVSNYHALLEYNGKFFLLRDLGSLNKTLLQYRPNDPTQILKPNVTHPITNGSKITFGSATMILSYLEVRANDDFQQQEVNPINQPLPQQPLPEKFNSFTSPLDRTLLPPQQRLLQQQLLQQQQKIDQLPIQPPSPPLHHTPSKSSSSTTATTLPVSPKASPSPSRSNSSNINNNNNNNNNNNSTFTTTTTTTTSAPITPKKDIEMNDINNVNINKRKESEINTSNNGSDIQSDDEDSNVVIPSKKQKHDTKDDDEIDTPTKQQKQSPKKQSPPKQSPPKQSLKKQETEKVKVEEEEVEESDNEIPLSPAITEFQEDKVKKEKELKKQQEKEKKTKEKADKAKIKEEQETTSQGSESESSYSNSGSNSSSTPSRKKVKPPKDEYISNLLSTTESLSKRKTTKPERLEEHYILLNETNNTGELKHSKKTSTTTNTSSSSNNNINNSNIKILFSMFSEDTAKELENILLKLGGSMASNSSECTHLVSDEMKRSKKILECISFGKQIVTSKWLKDSKKQGFFVDELPYHLKDKKAEAEWDFSLEKSLKIARDRIANSSNGGSGSHTNSSSSSSFGTPSSKPLFNNLIFYISKNSIPPKDFLKDIIEINGGILLDDISTVEEDDSKDIIIIANADKDKRFFKKWSDSSYKILKGDFILLSILSQSLVYEGCEI